MNINDPALYPLDCTPEPGYQDAPPVDKLRACLAVGIGVRELWNMQRYLVCFDPDPLFDMSDIPF